MEKAVNHLEGVEKATVNLTTEKMTVEYQGNLWSPEAISKAVADAGYEAVVYNPDTAKSQEEREGDKLQLIRKRLFWSSIFTLPLFILAMGPMIGLPAPAFVSPGRAPVAYTLFFVLDHSRDDFRTSLLSKWLPNPSKRPSQYGCLVALATSAAFLYSLYGTYHILLDSPPSRAPALF